MSLEELRRNAGKESLFTNPSRLDDGALYECTYLVPDGGAEHTFHEVDCDWEFPGTLSDAQVKHNEHLSERAGLKPPDHIYGAMIHYASALPKESDENASIPVNVGLQQTVAA